MTDETKALSGRRGADRMTGETTTPETGGRTSMQLREAARKVLAKYERGIGLDNEVTEARIRPFSFGERAAALNLRRTYPRGFEPPAVEDPEKGPVKPRRLPRYARGVFGWLQRIVAGRVVNELKHSEVDWWYLAKNADEVRREILQDFCVIYRELSYFQTIATSRDAEAFNSAHVNSGLRKDNADLVKQADALRELLRERDEELERQNGMIGRLERLVDDQAASINDHIKMIEVIEGLPCEDAEDGDDGCTCDPDADEACTDCPEPFDGLDGGYSVGGAGDPNITVAI